MSTFTELQKFISEDMRMSQVYQPVMLMALLKNGGEATVTMVVQAALNKAPASHYRQRPVLQDASAGGGTDRQGVPDRHLVKLALSSFPTVLARLAPSNPL